jgi:AraC-like DNA-binding protein
MRNVADGVEKKISNRNSQIDGALRYLYLHFREDPRLSKVAEISGYTPNYFSKIFADYMGKSYTEYLGMLKTNLARMLLASTEQSVAQIAFSCGFNSLSNFYRTFNENAGIPPNEYRNKKQNINTATKNSLKSKTNK